MFNENGEKLILRLSVKKKKGKALFSGLQGTGARTVIQRKKREGREKRSRIEPEKEEKGTMVL